MKRKKETGRRNTLFLERRGWGGKEINKRYRRERERERQGKNERRAESFFFLCFFFLFYFISSIFFIFSPLIFLFIFGKIIERRKRKTQRKR